MKSSKATRCAIYTRVSTDQGLEQEFNSLDAQREASEAYVKSQAHEGWTCLPEHYDDGGYSGGSLERPALHHLLEAVRSRKLDVIVVYKVDRLTRSLADFAKLVELFDANAVSFVSVTQSFNTTSSMGRLTLNVLLSFAQFEREVTGERIRDKIAASKKKGMWMGGVVPYGYRVEDRKLLIEQKEAETVRMIFTRYLALGSIPSLIEELQTTGIRTRARKHSSGRNIGGILFTTGPLHHMLKNRMYIGDINHHGKSYVGEHEAIVDHDLFEKVQHRLSENRVGRVRSHEQSASLLIKLIYDDRGNRMSPVFAKKGSIRYRYYQSWVLAQGRKHDAGTVSRVPAEDIELAVSDALHSHLKNNDDGIDQDIRKMIRSHVESVIVYSDHLDIKLRYVATELNIDTAEQQDDPPIVLTIPWRKPSATHHREVLCPANSTQRSRPIRTETRSRLITGIARGRQWLEDLSNGQAADMASIAHENKLSDKSVRSMISLAFLAPDIVQAAIDGRLPRGLGISQMTDLPSDWDDQRKALGLV